MDANLQSTLYERNTSSCSTKALWITTLSENIFHIYRYTMYTFWIFHIYRIETQNVNKVYLCIWKFSDSVVNVLHTLLKTNITKQDMDKSEYNAIQFEGYYQAYYEIERITFNIHTFSHVIPNA